MSHKKEDPSSVPPAPPAGGEPAETPLPEAIARELQELREKAAELDGLRLKAKERDDFLALAQRVQADFVNYQKRMAAEKEQWGKFLHADLIRDLLPALDALEACACMAGKGGDPAAHLEGYRIAVKELVRLLEKNGLSPIAPAEGEFDTALHEAIGVKEMADRPASSVAELMRKGYRLHDRILRPAQVLVSKRPAAGTAGPEAAPGGAPA
jgi:molecular chaperone GrpE